MRILALLLTLASTANADICTRTHESVLKRLSNPENQLSFANDGGIANGGVCWWHSRFTRNAAYLADFHPELPKPDLAEAQNIAFKLSHFQVAIIPGFRNLSEFSSAYQDVIQHSLDAWQKKDGFIKQAWIKGLKGKAHMSPEGLQSHIESIVDYFKQANHPVYLKLQFPGITAHAFLLVGTVQATDGYKLLVIDSNKPGEITTAHYFVGDTSMAYYFDNYIPYIDQEKDFNKIAGAFWQECEKEL